MQKTYMVYMHTSPSGKRYIGVTGQKAEKRWLSGHGYRKNDYFYRAIIKHGWKNIKHEILLKNLTKEEAEQKEIELIALHNSNVPEFGYNISSGGNFEGMHSEETRRKMSKAQKGNKKWLGKKHSEETKRKMSEVNRGKTLSTETCQKISESKKGMKHSDETKLKMKERMIGNQNTLGVYPSIETRKKMSESQKGRKHSYETKEKISNANKGKVVSSETRKKLRDANIGKSIGANNPRAKAVLQFNSNGEFLRKFDYAKQADVFYNSSEGNVSACCRGLQKTAYGFIWRYADDESQGF